MDENVDPRRVTPDHHREPPLVQPPGTGSRTRRIVFLVLLVVILGGGYWWWSHHRAQQPQHQAGGQSQGRFAQGAPQPVGFATVDKGDIRIILNALGTVTSLDAVTVYTQISGQLQQVGFQEGQQVKKGDFLAQIDPRPYQAAVEQAEGTLAKDQGLLAQAQSDLKRYQTLGRQDSIAQQQLDDQRFLVMQYTGTVKTDQGALDTAKLNLAYCRIIAPIDGQVGLRLVDPGNYVQASTTTGLVSLTQMQPISVLFSVPEDDLPSIFEQVHKGQTLSVDAYDRANVKKLATGHLSTMDNLIDTTTGTLKLRAIFDNPDEMLYPNQFVNARLLVDTLKQTVRVPVPAVQTGAPGTFVYLINANNTVSVKTIKVGPVDGQYQAVLSGLNPGDRVVTDGTDRLRDGAQVTLPQANNGQNAQNAQTGASAEEPARAKGKGHRRNQSAPPSQTQ
jgi:multidrug efflux system membrane fusion protein